MKWICKACKSCNPCILEIEGHGYVNPLLCPYFTIYDGLKVKWEILQE